MDEKEIMQGAGDGAENDSFLEGWEDTNPGPAEAVGDGGDQAVSDSGAEGAVSDPEPAGEAPAGGSDGGDAAEAQEQGQDPAGGDQAGGDQAPRTWELHHLGQVITAQEADMVALANKGLDYDRIRAYNDEARPVMDLFRSFAQRAGMEVPAYLNHIRAQAKQAEGMSAGEAKRAVELEDREAAVAQQEEIRQQQEAAARQEMAMRQAREARVAADLQEFREVFPEAAQDPQSIPPEVWAEVRAGRTLVGAYARYSAGQARQAEAQAQAEAQILKQNENNASRTVGSMRSAGANNAAKDPFLEGWDE